MTPNSYRTSQTCQSCREIIGEFARKLLSENPGQTGHLTEASQHVNDCVPCGWATLDIAAFMSARSVRQMMDRWASPHLVLSMPQLEGLRELWHLQLGAAQLVKDDRATARGLSVLGLIERGLDDTSDEAIRLHELALRKEEKSGDMRSAFISHADLAYIASWRPLPDYVKGVDHLELALELARTLGDKEGERRLQPLMRGTAAAPGSRVTFLVKDMVAALDELRQTMVNTGSWQLLEPDLLKNLEQFAHQALGFHQLKPALAAFYESWLTESYQLATGGQAIPIVGSAAGLRVVDELMPRVDGAGFLFVSIKVDPSELEKLPEPFVIEALFLETQPARKVAEVLVGPSEREMLVAGGLQLIGKLPEIDGFLPDIRRVVAVRQQNYIEFPSAHLELLVRKAGGDEGHAADSSAVSKQ